ncbi:MAG: Protease prsW [Parcubacteria group bacterium Licking1014_17]|nr:MAG: Protease prsW [Parcubacteria group bacterium Licking1014_17]
MLFNNGFAVSLGMVPSLTWLIFYLHKDKNPEPKYLVSRTFFMGIILAPIAAVLQLFFSQQWEMSQTTFVLISAFIEEVIKYSAVRFLILHNPEFDEPADAMIYMIVAGLGFAAIENTLVLFRAVEMGALVASKILFFRFVGATLLHALSSGLVGYFLGLAWFYHRHSRKIIFLGIALASIFHFAFNIILVTVSGTQGFFYSTILLVFSALIISLLFKNLSNKTRKFNG